MYRMVLETTPFHGSYKSDLSVEEKVTVDKISCQQATIIQLELEKAC